MKTHQGLARRYRPQTFEEVVGQEVVVTTLKNAIRLKRVGSAYLFCGSRGTGKTTLARIFAKALNCVNPTAAGEPCNGCFSCKEIAAGHSLDVLEIDGASHRGIDDVRTINETVGYMAASGGWKIYLIDEVHMLTKEAFNALLKTLEEPPAKVLFLFATTEPHKLPSTILSRCQRFNLKSIPVEKIVDKLQKICLDLKLSVEKQALHIIAKRAEGGLRDAESLLDQMISFHEEAITAKSIQELLGMVSKDIFFTLDQEGKNGNLAHAFEVVHLLFTEGKDLTHFVENLIDHLRTLLLHRLGRQDEIDPRYESSAKLYTQEQLLTLLDLLIPFAQEIRFAPSPKFALENALLKVLRCHQRLPIEFLVKRLSEMEQSFKGEEPRIGPKAPLKKVEEPKHVTEDPTPITADLGIQVSPFPQEEPKHITEDPTPTTADLGIHVTPLDPKTPLKKVEEPKHITEDPTAHLGIRVPPSSKQHRYDTLLQFAAVELEGTIQK